ncbi:hypothetical protein V5799_023689 [Amblyomma americanum]|uniref:Secreted protein n=1 Tax=Amblyomma americanum TaxID=6943 RepID=A0AAQ4FHT1_AMBAM
MQTLLHPFFFVTQLLVLAYLWCAVYAQVPLELSTPVYADEDHDLPPAACGLPVLVKQPATFGTPPVLCHYKTTALSELASSSAINCQFSISSSPLNCLFSSVRVSGHLRAAKIQTLLHPFLFVSQLLVLAYLWRAVFAQVPLELSTPVYADENHDLPPAACGLPVLVKQPATVGTPRVLCHYKTTALSEPSSSSAINCLFSSACVSGHRRMARMQTLLHPSFFVTLFLVLAYPWCAVLAQVPLELWTPVYADEDHDLPPAACGLPVLVLQPATVGTPPVLCRYKTAALAAPESSSYINCLFSSARVSEHRTLRVASSGFATCHRWNTTGALSLQDNSIVNASIVITNKLPVLNCARQWASESGKDSDTASSVPFRHPVAGPRLSWCAIIAQVPFELSTPVYAEEDHDLPPEACEWPLLASLPATVGTPPVLCHHKITALSPPASSSNINCLFSSVRFSAHRRAVRIQTLLHPFFFVAELLVLAYPWFADFAQVPLEHSTPVFTDEDHDLPAAACGLPVLVSQPATVGTPPVLCRYKTAALAAPESSSYINFLFSRARVSEHRVRVSGHLRAARIQTLLHPFLFVTQLLVLAYPWCAIFAQVPFELSTPVYADEDHDLPPAACGLPVLVLLPATAGTPTLLCHYKTAALSAPASSSPINYLFSIARVSGHRRAARIQTLLHPFLFVTQFLVLAYPWCAIFAQVPFELSTPVYADEDHDLPPAACRLPVLVSQPATVGTPPMLCHHMITALSAPASSSSINCLFSSVRFSGHRRAARIQTLLHPFLFVSQLLVLAYPWRAVFAQVPLELSMPVYADENHDLPPAACGLPVLVKQPATVGTPPVLCHYKTTALSEPSSSSAINCLFSSACVSWHRRAARMQTLLHPSFFVTLLLVLAYPWCAVLAQVPLELWTPVYSDDDHRQHRHQL